MNWCGFEARVRVIIHKILHPTHVINWRVNVDEICPGDITCETCNVLYWCRWYDTDHKGEK
jgi:hypothetical protein